MIKNYILRDGGRIAASCAEEFVRELREGSRFDYDCTDNEYMAHFAGRYKDMTGKVISTDTVGHFMADLLRFGYVKEE